MSHILGIETTTTITKPVREKSSRNLKRYFTESTEFVHT